MIQSIKPVIVPIWTRIQYFWNELIHWGMTIHAPMMIQYLIIKTDLERKMRHEQS